MAQKQLKNIFLSASIPLPQRDPLYFQSADPIAIRDAVIALSSLVLPRCRLVWGGHPSITPLIYYVLQKIDVDIPEHVVLFQSAYFHADFPQENDRFQNIVYTPACNNREESLAHMRRQMLTSFQFSAGIFIGGMEGVETEYELFRQLQPQALILPIASTGGAARNIYNRSGCQEKDLATNYAYASLLECQLFNKL